MTTVAEDVSPASLEVLATRTGRSRFPVVQRATRRVLGFVHVKDVLGYAGAARRAPIPAEVIRPLAVVPPDRTLADLLLAMRRERRHIVLVSDGRRPLGVVTLDDVLTRWSESTVPPQRKSDKRHNRPLWYVEPTQAAGARVRRAARRTTDGFGFQGDDDALGAGAFRLSGPAPSPA